MKIFISYARQDYEYAKKFYTDLKNKSLIPWLDVEDILPGQNWEETIKKAIKESNYFIALLSFNSLSKRGFVQKELKMALDILDELPNTDIFIIPVRLDECNTENEKLKEIQWINIFPSYDECFNKILQVLKNRPEQDSVGKQHGTYQKNYYKRFKNSLEMEFVYTPPGTFMMGSPENEIGRNPDDETLHEVSLTRGFYIQTTLVTEKQWRDVIKSHNSFKMQGIRKKFEKKEVSPSILKSGDNYPVENVTWFDVQNFFIKELNYIEHSNKYRKYRLPTEAEWEYACRAGSDTSYCFGNDVKKLPEYAWFGKKTERRKNPVGQLKPSAWGLYDMHGNLWEWCEDNYSKEMYKKGGQTDPLCLIDPSMNRVIRGGSWHDGSNKCRSASRHSILPKNRGHHIGFRLVRDMI